MSNPNPFNRGYADYVNGFDPDETGPMYMEGYETARSHFMNDISYDENIVVNPW